jgi:hypothetical protein
MAKSNSLGKRAEEELTKFRVELSFVAIGLFLGLGIQNIIQFVEVVYPHITAYFFLTLGVGSLVMVLFLVIFSARLAGIGQSRHR